MSDYFQTAYQRARRRFTQDQWLALDPRQITDAIYREMRQMDAEAVAARTQAAQGLDSGERDQAAG